MVDAADLIESVPVVELLLEDGGGASYQTAESSSEISDMAASSEFGHKSKQAEQITPKGVSMKKGCKRK